MERQEEEKKSMLEEGKMKRWKLLEKLKKRKETKPEKMRRLEEEKRKEN